MKATAKALALGVVLLLAQSLAATALPAYVRPDFLLVFALAMGLRGSPMSGLILAFGFGLAVDVLSGAPPGLFALLRGTACAATRMLDGALYLRAPGPWASFVAGYAVVDVAMLGLALNWFAPEAAVPWLTLALRLPGVAITSAIAAAPLLGVFLRLDADPNRDTGLGLIAPGARS